MRSGAHIAAIKYSQPILGLIFLRYEDILFKQHHDEILPEYEKCKGMLYDLATNEKSKYLKRNMTSNPSSFRRSP